MGTSNSNVISLSQNTATALFTGGSTTFSGMIIINDINSTGQSAVFICGGGIFKLISQTSTAFANTSSPNAAQIGYYIVGAVMYIKPGRAGTTQFRTLSLRTRNSQ